MKNQFNTFNEMKNYDNSNTFDKDFENQRVIDSKKFIEELRRTKRKPNEDDLWVMPRNIKENKIEKN
ncbi:MAG: hypothetical protein ACOC1K_00915 [Nanoarchaeota archaeon]